MCVWGREVGGVKQNLRLTGLGVSCRERAGTGSRLPDTSRLPGAGGQAMTSRREGVRTGTGLPS